MSPHASFVVEFEQCEMLEKGVLLSLELFSVHAIHGDDQFQPDGQPMQIREKKLGDGLSFGIALLVIDPVENEIDMVRVREEILQVTEEFQLVQLIEKG